MCIVRKKPFAATKPASGGLLNPYNNNKKDSHVSPVKKLENKNGGRSNSRFAAQRDPFHFPEKNVKAFLIFFCQK